MTGPREKLCEQDLRANVPLFSIGALAPLNHLGPGELIVEENSLVLVSAGHDRRPPTKSFTFGRIAGNSGALLRSAGQSGGS